MVRTVKVAMMLVALTGVYQVVARANGVGMPPPSTARTPSKDEMAVAAYNSGIAHRDRAAKLEKDAKSDADRMKNQPKVSEEYAKALKDFSKAAEINPRMPQAFNGMGFAYRKMGDYDKALQAYDRALGLNATFAEAIEYRGEAYLGLNRLDDAKQAYLTLFAMDRTQADDLMQAMSVYVTKKKADPTGVDAAALAAFEAWIAERSGVAQQTKPMALNAPHGSWSR